MKNSFFIETNKKVLIGCYSQDSSFFMLLKKGSGARPGKDSWLLRHEPTTNRLFSSSSYEYQNALSDILSY